MTKEELLEEVANLRAELDYQKARCLDRSGKDSSARWKAQVVQGLRHKHPLERLLLVAQLSRSTFYHAGRRGSICGAQAAHRRDLRAPQPIRLPSDHGGVAPGWRTGQPKTVQKLMQTLGEVVGARQEYRSYRGPSHHVAANVLARRFAERPNEKWVTDVTEFNVRGEKLYLSPVMDLYNGEIVATQPPAGVQARGQHVEKGVGSADQPIGRFCTLTRVGSTNNRTTGACWQRDL